MLIKIPICALVRHLQGMLDVQLPFDEHDYEHATVIEMDFYHLQNMPQNNCCSASWSFVASSSIAINLLSASLPETL